MALPLSRKLNGQVERPHWAARAENRKNVAVARLLSAAHWEPRIQPYASYGSRQRVRILGRALFASPRTPANHHDQPVYDMRSLARRGFRNFMSQPDPGLEIEIDLPTVHGTLTTKAHTDRSGLIDEIIEAQLEPGTHEAVIRTFGAKGPVEVTAELLIVDESANSVAVVSDVDDTVMVTLLPRPLLAAWNAFVIDQASRRIVPGMPVLYQQIRGKFGPNTPFIYLSTGAWNVSPFLQRFLFKNGYPTGPLLLTDWGPTNTGLFRSGQEHKTRSLESLREFFPNMRWILVGDDGQHDPHIYGDFVARHPEDVTAVAIRELTDDQQDLAHASTRPLRSVAAAVRQVAGIIPRVWQFSEQGKRRPEKATEGGAHPGTGTSWRIPSPAVSTTGHIAEDQDQLPSSAPPEAARTGVTWVTGADGFHLITALRSAGVLSSPQH